VKCLQFGSVTTEHDCKIEKKMLYNKKIHDFKKTTAWLDHTCIVVKKTDNGFFSLAETWKDSVVNIKPE